MRTRFLLVVACVGVAGCASNYQMHRVASALWTAIT